MTTLSKEELNRMFESVPIVDFTNLFKNCITCPCQDKTNSDYTICTSKDLCRFQSHCLGGVYLCEKDI